MTLLIHPWPAASLPHRLGTMLREGEASGCGVLGFWAYTVELCGGTPGIGPFYWSGCCDGCCSPPRSNSALDCLVDVISREVLATVAKLGSGGGSLLAV